MINIGAPFGALSFIRKETNMKVIEVKSWVFPFDCIKCKSKLEAEKGDIRVGNFGGSYCDRGERKYYVECCECGEIKIISDKDIPPKAANGVQSKRAALD